MIDFNIFLSITSWPSHKSLSWRVAAKTFKAVLPAFILTACPVHLNFLDLITLTSIWWKVQTTNFLIVKPFSLSIFIPSGPKCSPQDPFHYYLPECWTLCFIIYSRNRYRQMKKEKTKKTSVLKTVRSRTESTKTWKTKRGEGMTGNIEK